METPVNWQGAFETVAFWVLIYPEAYDGEAWERAARRAAERMPSQLRGIQRHELTEALLYVGRAMDEAGAWDPARDADSA
jgi:hypothetical protein